MKNSYRRTTQELLPLRKPDSRKGEHDIYPDEFGYALEDSFRNQRGTDWTLENLPTQPTHLYDVHRFNSNSSISVETNGKCHVMSLVEGDSIIIETETGYRARFNYADTFVLPAAAGKYRVINESSSSEKLTKAFVK